MFSKDQALALRTLNRLWSHERFVLIGASAMRWHKAARSRETHDIDLVVALSLDRFAAGLQTEPGWSRHPKREQTWLAPGDVSVDIIPVGKVEDVADVMTWPESGFQMSLVGLRLALNRGVIVEAAPNLTIRVAPLEVIALLKMVAFLDRPHERDRDLEDIALILDEFIDGTDERRYADEILDLALKYEETSPFLLGKALAPIVNQLERNLRRQVHRPGQGDRRFDGNAGSDGPERASQLAPGRWGAAGPDRGARAWIGH